MTSLAKAIVTETDGTTKHILYPISTTVNAYGKKKPDEFNGVFKIQDNVKENYTLQYIEDIVDTEGLTAIWNFQLSGRDEGGSDLDCENVSLSAEPTEAQFVRVTDVGSKFEGHYAAAFIVDDNAQAFKVNATDITSVFDLDNHFDIYIWWTPIFPQFQVGNEPIIWSFYDGGEGIEIGITGDTVDDTEFNAFIRVGNGTVDSYTGTQNVRVTLGGNPTPILFRCYKGGDGIIHLEVNGIEDITVTDKTTGTLQPTGNPLIFGNGRGDNDRINAYLHQVRLYNGVTLTSNEATRISQAKPQPFTMKFAGTVQSITDSTTTKKVQCMDKAAVLIQGRLDSTTNWDDNAGSNVFDIDGTDDFQEITQQVVNELAGDTTTFLVRRKDDYENQTGLSFTGNFVGIGSFAEFMLVIGTMSNTTFYTTARGLIIIEDTPTFSSSSGVDTSYVFSQDDAPVYDILDTDEDSINSIDHIKITNATDSVVSNVSGDTQRTLRLNIYQLDTDTDLDLIKTLIGQNFANTKVRYTVASRAPIHHARFNHIVNVVNSTKSIDVDDIIAQVDSYYPVDAKGNRAYIKVGENDIDNYEVEKSTQDVQDGLVDTDVTNNTT